MSIDNRGTKKPRGKAWRNSIYEQIAVSFVSDQCLYNATYSGKVYGVLSDNAKGYHYGSPINFAKKSPGHTNDYCWHGG